MSDLIIRMEEEAAVSPAERADPLFSCLSNLSDTIERQNRNDMHRPFTCHCKFCGRANTVQRPPPQNHLDGSSWVVPIAPTLPNEEREAHRLNIEAALSDVRAAEEAMRMAMASLTEARQKAAAVVTKVKEINEVEWTRVLGRLQPGQMVLLKSNEIYRIKDLRPETGRVVVTPSTYLRDAAAVAKASRQISYRAIWLPESPQSLDNVERLQRATEKYQEDEALHLALKSQGCPTPCAKCGHVYCYSYHYANRSDLGGWEIYCAPKQCSCFNCTENRGKNRYDYGCCQCSLPPYCECARHNKY